jgi:hypothetical protein
MMRMVINRLLPESISLVTQMTVKWYMNGKHGNKKSFLPDSISLVIAFRSDDENGNKSVSIRVHIFSNTDDHQLVSECQF